MQGIWNVQHLNSLKCVRCAHKFKFGARREQESEFENKNIQEEDLGEYLNCIKKKKKTDGMATPISLRCITVNKILNRQKEKS